LEQINTFKQSDELESFDKRKHLKHELEDLGNL
jgi:hypothetical protein